MLSPSRFAFQSLSACASVHAAPNINNATRVQSPTSSRPSQIIGQRYVLSSSQPFATTAMSTLHRANDLKQTNEPVILKQLCTRESGQEVEILTKIKNLDIKHCIQLKDIIINGSDNNSTILVLPVLHPLPAQSDYKFDLITISRHLRQLLSALKQLHANGIAHLDISPANIMLDNSGDDHLVLIDFGLATQFLIHQSSTHANRHPQGRGTPGYMSPEMLAGEATKGTTDIYSAGVVFGQFLNSFITHPSLSLLGSRMVDPTMTTTMARTITESLDEQAFQSMNNLDTFSSSYCHVPILRHAAHLLSRMLEPEASTRITAAEALKHPFLTALDEEFFGTDHATFTERFPRSVIHHTTLRRRERIYCYERC